ncbi:MAG: CoB--CoM heterodisulfide reductase iron-sulfur subunit B family protein [Phycisphaerae bacterium]|nr:CoB--CoM heterodisulfide reductase iron-sulfur subunit B family protein [Phycisphaerae bacterium]
MRMGFFPGCSLEGSSREYLESLRAIAPALGLELAEVPDWNCCGATAAHTLNHKLALALPARILALAEKAGLDELLVPCSACFSRLAATRHELAENAALRKEIADIIEMPYQGRTEVLNALEVLARCVTNNFKDKVRVPFAHKVACYYGCYLTRPAKIATCARAEDPQEMDELMKIAGAEPIDWAFKVECCGAGLSVSRTSTVAELSGRIVEDAVRRGAEALVVACPMCHTNLDLRRDAITSHRGQHYTVPVLYISQVLGLALGLDEQTLGLHRHHVPVRFAARPAAPQPVLQTSGQKED